MNRCYFVEYDNENSIFLKPKHEYRSGENISSMVGYDFDENQITLGKRILKNTKQPFIIDSVKDFNVAGFKP